MNWTNLKVGFGEGKMEFAKREKGQSFENYLDKLAIELKNLHLSRKDADNYSETIIDEIKNEYNLFGEEAEPKTVDKIIIQKISDVFDALILSGLDVNSDSDENALNSSIWIENIDIAIMLAKKFLDNGADPNLKLTCEGGESLYQNMDFAVGYDMFGDELFMKLWLLLIAYGGCDSDGNDRLIPAPGEAYDIAKNINNISFFIDYREDGHHVMHFYDKETNSEFAMYEKLYTGG